MVNNENINYEHEDENTVSPTIYAGYLGVNE
jgi:hypothetical protein